MSHNRRSRSLLFLLAAACWLAGTAVLLAGDQGASSKENELLNTLRTAAPADKALACKHLAIHGTSRSVPDLAPLLANEQLASWARIALEAIPGPEADEALRKASATLSGKLLVGAINSIGVRQDARAVEVLAGRLKDENALVAQAAAVALGHIANDAATKTLRQALPQAAAEVRGAVAEGCILCAERLVRDGKASEAAEVYDEVRQAEVPKARKLEATRGAILARGAAGIPLLIEQLGAADRDTMRIALAAARELPGQSVSTALAGQISRTTSDRAALVLHALADRNDRSVLPAVLDAAQSGEQPVRIAALSVVGRLGNVASLPALLEIAEKGDAEVAEAAQAAITALADKNVDADVAARLSSADGRSLIVLIGVVGQRRIDATAQLIKALDHADPAVRSAALSALGTTIAPKDLPVLVAQVVKPRNEADAQQAQLALRTACLRMPDRDDCAGKLSVALLTAPEAAKASLLETIGSVGGAKALATMAGAVRGDDAQLQDTGSRLLGEWMTIDAAPVLLELAKDAPGDKYRVRALRGYIRMARQFVLPESQRAEMCRHALAVANRMDEQKLVLAVLERYPHADTLKVALAATQLPGVGEDAGRTTQVIAKKLAGDPAKVRELIGRAGVDPLKVDIVKAEYGLGVAQKDVTKTLQDLVVGLPLIVLPSASYNDTFGGDPVPGTEKTLKVHYQINGKPGDATFAENALIVLPMPK